MNEIAQGIFKCRQWQALDDDDFVNQNTGVFRPHDTSPAQTQHLLR